VIAVLDDCVNVTIRGVCIQRVMRDGLEGLVLKAVDGAYEPGKRHWLKLKKCVASSRGRAGQGSKKNRGHGPHGTIEARCPRMPDRYAYRCRDYLNQGAMADTADLVVLGAWGACCGARAVFVQVPVFQRRGGRRFSINATFARRSLLRQGQEWR
jgi:hypothetical protein